MESTRMSNAESSLAFIGFVVGWMLQQRDSSCGLSREQQPLVMINPASMKAMKKIHLPDMSFPSLFLPLILKEELNVPSCQPVHKAFIPSILPLSVPLLLKTRAHCRELQSCRESKLSSSRKRRCWRCFYELMMKLLLLNELSGSLAGGGGRCPRSNQRFGQNAKFSACQDFLHPER